MILRRSCIVLTLMLLVIGCNANDVLYKVEPKQADFGSVNLGEYTDLAIEVTNKSAGLMQLIDVNILNNYDFSIIDGGTPPIQISAGNTHKIKIRFTPSSEGVQNAQLQIKHNASIELIVVDLTGIGNTIAKIDMPVKYYDFGKVIYSQTATHDFEVINIGSDTLSLNSFTFTGSGAVLYSVIAGGSVPVNILPGKKETFTVEFAPLSIANYPTVLEIEHNAVNEGSPIKVVIDGEGVKFDPQIMLSKSSPWDFGSVVSINPSSEVCEITNTGVDPLTLNSASLTSATDFSIVSLTDSNGNALSYPHVVPVGLKVFLTVMFSPTATAPLNDTLSIYHNGTNESSPLNITVQGQGTLITVKTFTYTGAVDQWTVPAGVTSLDVEILGAEGGQSSSSTGYPGKGGKVTAKLSVSPGDVLYIHVGGEGVTGVAGVGGSGGWNGGGLGGSYGSSRGGGGGGGASDIRKNGTTLADRIIVAGGGGGGGHNGGGEAGGHGGGLTGQKGANTLGGGGGTQTAGGIGGDAGSGRIADPGGLGIGGDAWTGSTGGGGGAGYFGGGGGSYEAGGGGSSFTDSSATNVVHTQGSQSGNGQIKISY